MDLTSLREPILDYVASLRIPDQPAGHYRMNRDGESELYASCDVVILLTIMGEDVRQRCTAEERRAWIDAINAYADPDGTYRSGWNHSVQHRNGMVIEALGPLGGRQPYPVEFYKDFAAVSRIGPWLEQIDWARQWSASHLFWGGMHCYSLSRHCSDDWRKAVFAWLDAEIDPRTGWWRKGIPHSDAYQPLGGGAHIWPMYQHHDHPFPYPCEVIDSILALQHEDGRWMGFGNYMDLDALYGLLYMGTLAPAHRREDICVAVGKHGDLAEATFHEFLASEPPMHYLLAAVGELGLLHQLDPDRFPAATPWTDIFSDRRLYDTQSVECA